MTKRRRRATRGFDKFRMWLDVGQKVLIDIDNKRCLRVGDYVHGLTLGMIVDIEEDAVVVARRNASGRCMELVFVGDAARMLRPA